MDEVHMQSLKATPSVEADGVAFPFESPTNAELENFVVSPCGRFESFDFKGNHFEIDWNEIAPPGAETEEEEGTPHEEFVRELDQYIEELLTQRETDR